MYNRGRSKGFSIRFQPSSGSSSCVPPPKELRGDEPVKKKGKGIETQLMEMGYGTGKVRSRTFGGGSHIGKRKYSDEESYFEHDDENQDLYQPAPGSPGGKKTGDDSDSDDALDAFMQTIEKEVKSQSNTSTETSDAKKDKGVRDDIDKEDDMETYFRYMEENPLAGLPEDDDRADIEYDHEGNAIIPEKYKIIDPLPPVNHDEIHYEPFTKNFYEEHNEITTLSKAEVNKLRGTLGLKATGIQVPNPVCSFAHFGFDEQLLKIIRKSEFTKPTPIQAQAIPAALSGRDVIGIAKTGSGKTAAFLWPLFVHIMDQPELKPGDGPIGLIIAPTRELSQQIYLECKKFGKAYNIHTVCAYGGGSMWEQQQACQEGAEIIVATPGRLIDLVKKKSTNLTRVTFVVFDEADRMFDMGFEPQVRSIANHVRPGRQTLLFSATFKKKVERLARDILSDPVRIIQGAIGEANQDITQHVQVFQNPASKWTWLCSRLVQFTSIGSVLIFVTKKLNSEELAKNLKLNDHKVALIHGDLEQTERNKVITSFKRKDVPILVATDVAARGLDIPSIKTVVNYDVARDIDTHTHRIGRTGRAGEKGTAFTLLTPKDKDFAGHLVRNLESVDQEVPNDLLEIAMQNPWFKKNRFKQGKAKKLGFGGSGLGYRARPGLGCPKSSGSGLNSGAVGGVGANIPPPISYSKSLATAGEKTNRISSLKSAFSSQYKTNFVAATNSEMSKTYESPEERMPPPPPAAAPKEEGRKRKSRWN